jgi:hypothetical protein
VNVSEQDDGRRLRQVVEFSEEVLHRERLGPNVAEDQVDRPAAHDLDPRGRVFSLVSLSSERGSAQEVAEHGHEERLTVDDQNVRLKGLDVREPGDT